MIVPNLLPDIPRLAPMTGWIVPEATAQIVGSAIMITPPTGAPTNGFPARALPRTGGQSVPVPRTMLTLGMPPLQGRSASLLSPVGEGGSLSAARRYSGIPPPDAPPANMPVGTPLRPGAIIEYDKHE